MQQLVAIALGTAGWRFARLSGALRDWFRDWAEAERGRFALWLPVAMGAGVIAHLSARSDPPSWLGFSLFFTALAIALFTGPWPIARAAAACVAAYGLGMVSAQVAVFRAPPLVELPRHAAMIEARVRVVELLPEGARITLEAARPDGADPLPRLLRIRMRARDDVELVPGDLIRVRAMVSPPNPPAYPGAWDLQRDAFFAGIGGYGFALGPPTVLDDSGRSGAALWLLALREEIAARVTRDIPGIDGAIAATLLTGFTSAIPEDTKQAFRDSGLAHLLAIAGLHIGIVMGLVLGATRIALAAWEFAALRWPTKQIAVLAALAAGGGYMFLTGAHVPIMRSFAMASLVALAVLAGRRAVSVRGLALAATVIMLMAPNEVLGVSFQLSFSAVLALIAGYEALRGPLSRLRGRDSRMRHFLHHLATLALTSALAGTASAPYGAYHFGRFQMYYVLANLLAVPITAMWVMPAGLLALALMPLHLEYPALAAMAWGIRIIVWVGRAVAALPDAVLAVPPTPLWGLAVTSVGIAWLGIWRTRVRLAGIFAIAIGILSPAVNRPPDVLMSADGRMLGVRTRAGVFDSARSGASKFTRDAWLQFWAAPAFLALPPVSGVAADGAIDCVSDACTLRLRDDAPPGIFLRGAAVPPSVCDAALLVSQEPIRLRCPTRLPYVDRFSVWRNGAHAIWLLPEGPRILSDRENRGTRPWVPPPPVPRARR
jgi:competence protein ComEC